MCVAGSTKERKKERTREAIHSHLEVLITLRYKVPALPERAKVQEKRRKRRRRVGRKNKKWNRRELKFFLDPSSCAERKFIKYLKVRKRLLSPGAINFHLHFIFVSPRCSSFRSSRRLLPRRKNTKIDTSGGFNYGR